MSSNQLNAAVTGKVARSPAAQFSDFMDKMKPQMALALPRHMNADRMARLAITAFSASPELQACSVQSIASSIMIAVQLGLEPGINGQGYLIPYKGTCTFVPGWKGLVDLVARAGRATVWTGTVRAGDEFEYQLGDAPFCRHKPGDGFDGEEFSHVYAIGRVRDASMAVIEVWTRAKVQRHLKQYNKVGGRHYALANENNLEMYGRKVALLQVLKYMPASIELANAIEVSHAAEVGKGAVIEGDFVRVFDDAQGTDPETGEIHGDPKPPAEAAQSNSNLPGAGTILAREPWTPSPAQQADIATREQTAAAGDQEGHGAPTRRTRSAPINAE